MNYLPIEQLKNAWVFKHKSLPIAEADLIKIKPMTIQRSTVLWDTFISKKADHPDFFQKGDWAFDKCNWIEQGKWEGIWDGDEPDLPTLITDHLAWDNNTVVYFCSDRNLVIETTWQIFKQYWKNFLFMDDGTILFGKKRDEAVQFNNTGYFKIGNKPNTNL